MGNLNNFLLLWVLKAYQHSAAVRKLVLAILPKKPGWQHLEMLEALQHCLVMFLCPVKEVQRCQELCQALQGLQGPARHRGALPVVPCPALLQHRLCASTSAVLLFLHIIPWPISNHFVNPSSCVRAAGEIFQCWCAVLFPGVVA